mmetsp:Transcript_30444/g.49236  ORF Transcript_30444/g.49236 Transcript_30444/m.49236 type:complete len:255 (+) Transcript_30444:440-1204(+)
MDESVQQLQATVADIVEHMDFGRTTEVTGRLSPVGSMATPNISAIGQHLDISSPAYAKNSNTTPRPNSNTTPRAAPINGTTVGTGPVTSHSDDVLVIVNELKTKNQEVLAKAQALEQEQGTLKAEMTDMRQAHVLLKTEIGSILGTQEDVRKKSDALNRALRSTLSVIEKIQTDIAELNVPTIHVDVRTLQSRVKSLEDSISLHKVEVRYAFAEQMNDVKKLKSHVMRTTEMFAIKLDLPLTDLREMADIMAQG